MVRSLYAVAGRIENDDRRKALAEWARKSEAQARILATLSLAESEEGIPLLPEAFDRDPWLLNVANGTFDLRTFELRSHRREDLLSKLTPVEYDPAAKAPLWEAFLERILPDPELRSFVQRAAGYSLTGSTREQVLFLLYGTGANGKSVFLEILRALHGKGYAQQADFSTFLVKKNEGIPNDRAKLAGARFVSAIETDEGRRFAEALVKQMTGGDTLTARFLHHEFFDFQPEFKLWLAANHKPVIRGTDHAIWRRIRLIPFTVTIPDPEQDKDLPEKLRKELPGILAWAVEGCRSWQTFGLGTPEAVRSATDEYRTEMDLVGRFLDECTLRGPRCEVRATPLYEAFKRWCSETGEKEISQTALGKRLAERGLERTKDSQNRVVWRGIGLPVPEGSEGSEGLPGFFSSDFSRRENLEKPSEPSEPSGLEEEEGVL